MLKDRARVAAVIGAVVVAVMLLPSALAAPPRPLPEHPSVTLPVVSGGETAIRLLGDRLPAVAAAYGKRPAQLEAELRHDKTLKVDKRGRLFYEDAPLPADLAAEPAEPAAALPAPLSDTFALHSKPGSERVIFLDFDGHLLRGTVWNASYANGSDISAPPFDIDGSPSTFNDTERTRIQQMWQRVAEDYAPFDVDVTTEYPGEDAITRSSSSDTRYGTRVLVSPISSLIGNFGGIAYIGVFDNVGDYYKPALVFPEKLANSEKYVGEAISHECGHNVGLSHDGNATSEYYSGHGTGETGWAPIMGSGYSRNLTQWSRGEYTGATNKEDDVAVIASNGLAVRADDHGDTLAAATSIAGTATGLVERSSDVDVFAFDSGAGTVTVAGAGALLGGNVDLEVALLDAAGTVITSANPVDALAATASASVAGGRYFVRVRPVGKGDPSIGYSAYGCLGAYALSVTAPPYVGNQPPVARATATPASGVAPLAVTFDGSTSSDPDGSIASWRWEFGDGATASGPTASHTYAGAGAYSARLTVTDDDGASASVIVPVTVSAAPSTTAVRVSAIDLSILTARRVNYASGSVLVTDLNGTPVSGATVRAKYANDLSAELTGVTGADGRATFRSTKIRRPQTVTLTVLGVSGANLTYDPADNIVTFASISATGSIRPRIPLR